MSRNTRDPTWIPTATPPPSDHAATAALARAAVAADELVGALEDLGHAIGLPEHDADAPGDELLEQTVRSRTDG